MSNIEKASRDAVEAARQGDQFAVMLAAIQAAQQTQPAVCQHHHQHAPAARSFEARKVVTYTACGCAAAAFASLFFMAFAIGATALAASVLVLWRLWVSVKPKD